MLEYTLLSSIVPILMNITGFTLTVESIVLIVGCLTSVLGIGYTWREKRINSLNGYRSYEKDLQEQMRKDIHDLQEGNEKYIMLRKKVLELPGIQGNLIIREIETEYKEMNPE